MLKEIIIFTL